MKYASVALIVLALPVVSQAQNRKQPELFEVPVIRSSWDDLTEGIKTRADCGSDARCSSNDILNCYAISTSRKSRRWICGYTKRSSSMASTSGN